MADDPVTVNGEGLSEELIAAEVQRLKNDYERQFGKPVGEGEEERLRALCIDNLVARALLRQEASGMEIPAEEVDAAFKEMRPKVPVEKAPDETLRDDLLKDLKVRKLLSALHAEIPEPDEAEIEACYRDHGAEFEIPEQVHARHIVKHLDQGQDRTAAYVEMLNVGEQLRQGVSFEELAARSSSCPDRGGDLGYFGRGQMVEEFEEVVFGMKAGEISDVFETPFGYHIARVEDVRPAGKMPLDEVRERLVDRLRDAKRMEAVQRQVEALKAKADIIVSE